MMVLTARLLLRRWIWVVAFILVAAVTAVGVLKVEKPVRHSVAQVLFVPPLYQPGVNGVTNPFLALSGSAAIVASVVALRVTDAAAVESVQQDGATGTYEVTPNLAENAGPILIVTADDTTAKGSKKTLGIVITRIQKVLLDLQTSNQVPTRLLITTIVLTSSPDATVVRKQQVQDAIGAAVAVLLVLIAGLILVERFRESRAATRPTTTHGPRRHGEGRAGSTAAGDVVESGSDPAHAAPPHALEVRARSRPAGAVKRQLTPRPSLSGQSPKRRARRPPAPGAHEASGGPKHEYAAADLR